MIKIKVDVREQELIQKIQGLIESIPTFKGLEILIENLPLGDVLLSGEQEDYVIIERKSINDLIASIKDGRYEEQSYRLNGLNHHNHNIVYLIEGDLNKMNRFRDTRIEKLTLYSAIFSLNYTKGFSVIRSFSMEESAIFICNSANKLRKNLAENKKAYYSNPLVSNTEITEITENTEGVICVEEEDLENKNIDEKTNIGEGSSDKDYISVVKKVKKENVTPDNIAEIMLSQIPGISSVTAIAIMEKYNTLPNLLKALEENLECLKDICYKTGKGQMRKINKTSIENIQKYLLKK